MYKVLIVDDETYTVQAIRSGLDWNSLGIEEVYSALCAEEAMELFSTKTIDIMVCDIEMPGTSGLELMEWVKSNYPATETIFLTCHSEFTYAQKAIHLGSFDYLLKPILFDELKSVIERALNKIREDRETSSFSEAYKKYRKLWNMQQPILVERFWQDIFSERTILPIADYIGKSIHSFEEPVHLTSDSEVLPILISIEQWNKELSKKDEEIMEYALRNTALEIILSRFKGQVFQDYNGVNFIVIYKEENVSFSFDELIEKCEQFKAVSASSYYCKLSCYIGKYTPIHSITETYNALLEMEQNNVTRSNVVLCHQDQKMNSNPLELPLLSDWPTLIEAGKADKLLQLITKEFKRLENSKSLDAKSLDAFYQEFIQIIYYVLHKKGLSANELFGRDLLNKPSVTRSLSQLQAWSVSIISTLSGHLNNLHNDNNVIDRVKLYIHDHINEEISREDIAAFVYLNSAYLSRLYRKETGESLSDYILRKRMELAKELLMGSDSNISYIAKSVGYTNFSHFSKMFKRVYGITPQDCRKS